MMLALLTGCGLFGGDTPKPIAAAVCVARPDQPSDSGSGQDDVEPNDGLAYAQIPRPGDDPCSGSASGTLVGTRDIDVYRTGMCGSSLIPYKFSGAASIKIDDPDVRTCVFFACRIGRPDVYACYETDIDDSGASPNDSTLSESEQQKRRQKTGVSTAITDDPDGGFLGCCRTGKGDVAGRVDCGGIHNQAVTLFVWIDAGDSSDESHRPYSLTYSVDELVEP